MDAAKVNEKNCGNIKVASNTNFIWFFLYSHQRMGTRNGGLGNKSTTGDHLYYSNFFIGQIPENRPGNLRRFAVTQTLVINDRIMLI